jgi:hypothetical protein
MVMDSRSIADVSDYIFIKIIQAIFICQNRNLYGIKTTFLNKSRLNYFSILLSSVKLCEQ